MTPVIRITLWFHICCLELVYSVHASLHQSWRWVDSSLSCWVWLWLISRANISCRDCCTRTNECAGLWPRLLNWIIDSKTCWRVDIISSISNRMPAIKTSLGMKWHSDMECYNNYPGNTISWMLFVAFGRIFITIARCEFSRSYNMVLYLWREICFDWALNIASCNSVSDLLGVSMCVY